MVPQFFLPTVHLLLPLEVEREAAAEETLVGVLPSLTGERLERLISLVDQVEGLRESLGERVLDLRIVDELLWCQLLPPPGERDAYLQRLERAREGEGAFVALWEALPRMEPALGVEQVLLRVGEEGVRWEGSLGLGEGHFSSRELPRHDLVGLYAALCRQERPERLVRCFQKLMEYDRELAAGILASLEPEQLAAIPPESFALLLASVSPERRLGLIAAVGNLAPSSPPARGRAGRRG